MKGYRTILVGLAVAILPPALTYLASVDWTQYVAPNLALAIAGAITIAMRVITTTPIGADAPPMRVMPGRHIVWLVLPGLALLLFGQARAADMPILKAPPAAAAQPSGFYLLLDASGAVLRPNGAMSALAPAGSGVSAGGGWDFRSNGLVIGLMAQGGWDNVRGTATCALSNCTSGSTWEGDVSARIGVTFAALNGMLGNAPQLAGLNAKLPVPLVAITPLDLALLYVRIGAVTEHLRVSLDGANASRNDIGVMLGAGLEIPVTAQAALRTGLDWVKFNDALCGGCALPTGRPSEWKARAGLVYRF